MRYVFRLLCVCALGVVPLTACGQSLGPMTEAFPCTEQGIRDAIAEGGGPHTFDCDGTEPVVTEETIVIDNDVILDGEGNLTIEGHVPPDHRVLSVPKGVKAELHRLATKGGAVGLANQGTLTLRDCVVAGHRSEFLLGCGAGISNAGEMTIIDSTVTQNFAGHGVGGGICNHRAATLMLVDSTVSDNGADGDGPGLYGGGIFNNGEMTIINSTVSGNDVYDAVLGSGLGGGIANAGWMSLSNSTVSGNSADSGDAIAIEPRFSPDAYTEIANTLIEGDCARTGDGSNLNWVSKGDNIESPGDTCGFDQEGDQAGVSAVELDLQPLADNGGLTETHAITADSAAFNAGTCEVDTDQRGVDRPQGTKCDVGAFELEVAP